MISTSLTEKPIERNRHKIITEEEFRQGINVDAEDREVVSDMMIRNKDIFAFRDTDLLTTDILQADIQTGNHAPINQRPYRRPLGQRQAVSDNIDEMLEAGLITHSVSPWNFPDNSSR